MRSPFRFRASRLTALFLLLVLAAVSYQCSKKSDDPASNTASVQGTWKFTGLTANPAVAITGLPGTISDLYSALVLVAPCSAQTTLTFNADGTMALSVPANCTALNTSVDVLIDQYTGFSSKAKWSVNGSKLTVTRADGKTQTTYDYTVSGNTLTLSGSDGTTTYTIKMQK
jgi:hypothetical protein